MAKKREFPNELLVSRVREGDAVYFSAVEPQADMQAISGEWEHGQKVALYRRVEVCTAHKVTGLKLIRQRSTLRKG